MGRLSQLTAGCAGVMVAVSGALHTCDVGDPPEGLEGAPAAALIPAGIALVLQVTPVPDGGTGRFRARTAAPFALVAAGLGGNTLAGRLEIDPGAAAVGVAGILVALTLLALLAYRVRIYHAVRRQRRLLDELHERQDFAQTLLQSMNEAVMVLDANYHVIDVNRRWRELTGHGDTLPESPPLPPPGTGGDWLLPRADGTDVPVLATMAAIPDAAGATRGYVATYVDIAERKQAEEKLTRHAADLERGNAELAAALAFKNDLTSMLTHDVAQPISSIASLADLLCADWADLPEDIRLELATKIDKNTRRLIKMMNDLQLLFRLDTGAVTARRVPVPLLEVVETVSASVAGSSDVEITIDEDLAALADRGHLTVIVENLLKNALAHGAPPIHIRAEREPGGTLCLIVQDSGAGIPEDVLPNLFGRFIKGAGLGLFIVRHLAEANGGSVRYEHAEPRGARLLVTLEAAPAL
ncbi:PAS domain-containing sensor histidine kinase [Actinoplanes flavus]|nr:PAS domain-containing sensor histidine kinase [Actinoplanes flavus]